MIDLCFFQAWLKKNFTHQKFEIEPIVDHAINITSTENIYFGIRSDSATLFSYKGNLIHFEDSNGFIIFDRVNAPSDETQFIGYVAYRLPS